MNRDRLNGSTNIATKSRGPVFPNARCGVSEHPDAPAYIVCTHVVCGTKPEQTVKSTSHTMGQIMCGANKHSNREMVIVCPACCVTKGWLDPLA